MSAVTFIVPLNAYFNTTFGVNIRIYCTHCTHFIYLFFTKGQSGLLIWFQENKLKRHAKYERMSKTKKIYISEVSMGLI